MELNPLIPDHWRAIEALEIRPSDYEWAERGYPLRRGELIFVTFGHKGHRQLAIVLEDQGAKFAFRGRTPCDRVKVRKFRERSKTWTKAVFVMRGEVLGRAKKKGV